MNNKTFQCVDCNRQMRSATVTDSLASRKICPQCHTKRLMSSKQNEQSHEGATFKYIESTGAGIKAWTHGVWVEDQALDQLKNTASLPFIYKHLAVMPDCHYGMGATVGSVVATLGAIVPAAVGVDIGCGMMALKTSLKAGHLPDNLSSLRLDIEQAVPHGRTNDGGFNDKGSRKTPVDHLHLTHLMDELRVIVEKHPSIGKAYDRAPLHAGTLGTGNHFIEICLDENQNVWIMLHSGSRGIGNRIGSYFIEKAKKDMEKWFINLPDKDLSYIPEGSENFSEYCGAVSWAQRYAVLNREIMMKCVTDVMKKTFGNWVDVSMKDYAVSCHHNYVAWERHFGKKVIVTRKGAVNAELGKLGIIPGSMGTKSYIVRGKGNPESFNSCSHGAGRIMSRTEAKKRFTLADHEKATIGVECRKDIDVIDETPEAYKDIDVVMEAQKDLVEIVHTLKQVLCVKG